MLKQIVRVGIIVAVIALVSFGVYWGVQKVPALLGQTTTGVQSSLNSSDTAQGMVPGAEGRPGRGQHFDQDGSRTPPEGMELRPHSEGFGDRRAGGSWLAGAAGIAKGLGVIGLITLLVVGGQYGWKWWSQRRKPQIVE